MVKIHTVSGNSYLLKLKFMEIKRALHDVSCHLLIGVDEHNHRVIIPLTALDSLEEVSSV